MNKKKFTPVKMLTIVAALSLGAGVFTAYRLAQPELQVSDLTLANLEALGSSLGDLDLDPFWPPKLPDGENRNALVPMKNSITNQWETHCTGSGSACRGVN